MDNINQTTKKRVYIFDPVGVKAGLDHYNDSLARELNANDIKATVYSNYSSEFSEKVFPFAFADSPSFFPAMLYSLFKMSRMARIDKPEFAILHFFSATKLSLWFLRRLKDANVKLILIVHDIESLISERNNDSEMNLSLEIADTLVVHNQFSKDELLKKYKTVAEKTVVISHGDFLKLPSEINKTDAKIKLGLQSDLPVVLFFGMIKPSKGLKVLLKAMGSVNGKLVVAGRLRKISPAHFSETVSALNSSGKLVQDIGYISNDKRDLYFKAADVIVLPYDKIFQSGVLIMALSYRLPIIASDLLPNLEFSKPIKAVELFAQGDDKDLASKLNALISDKSKQKLLVDNGVKLLEKNHNWNLIGMMFKKIIWQ